MLNATYLYFHSQSEDVSPILLASIAHYSYFSKRYVLVTNISRDKFPAIFRRKIEILQISDIESSDTKDISDELLRMWGQKKIKANCPAIEQHCFKRWLLLRDLYNNKIFDENCLVFAHDWDDLLFVPLTMLTMYVEKFVSSSYAVNNPFFISHTPSPVGQYLIPHFLLCNQKSVVWFRDCILKLANTYSAYHSESNFPDMSVWSYMYHCSIAKRVGIAKLWCEILPSDLLVDDNVRILRPERILFAHESVKIPPQFNFLDGDKNILDIKKYIVGDDAQMYAETSSGIKLKAVNTHYSGVEGKYILLRDISNKLVKFHQARPGLQELLACFVPGLTQNA